MGDFAGEGRGRAERGHQRSAGLDEQQPGPAQVRAGHPAASAETIWIPGHSLLHLCQLRVVDVRSVLPSTERTPLSLLQVEEGADIPMKRRRVQGINYCLSYLRK